MRKTIYLKTIFLLCALLAGVVNVNAQTVVSHWTRVTDLSDVQTDDIVVIVDESQGIALPNTGGDFQGVAVTLSGGYISSDVSDNIKWTLTKTNSGTKFKFTRSSDSQILYGDNGTGLYRLGMNSDTYTTSYFQFNSYASGGKMYFETPEPVVPYYVSWNNNKAQLSGLNSDAATLTLYKLVETDPIVKWKKVNGTNVTLSNNDVVVIVDLKTGRALSNDKADKDPDAVAVELNVDNDRILGDVAEKVQWTFTNNGGMYKFAAGENNLYADTDSKGLKVGTATTSNEFAFSYNDVNGTYMGITIGETPYYAVVEESMFSNSWKLVEGSDDKAKDGQIAIFKKVADEKIIPTLEFASDNYAGNKGDVLNINATCTGANVSEITWTSLDPTVATVNSDGEVTLLKRGIVTIKASIAETDFHDKATATCTVRIDDPSASGPGGSMYNPLTVADAKELAEKGEVTIAGTKYTLQEGVNYYIMGKVSKVNSGLMAMFGDMDMGSIGGTGGSGGMDFDEMMDDMDFDMDSMDEMGFDMSSLGFDFSSIFGSSDKVTYYISDDGTKDNQLKVVNGLGTIKSNNGGAVEYNAIPNLSPGDCVVVCGPLVYSEDTNALSSLMGGSSSNEEPKKTAKVDELNYLAQFDPTLLVGDKEIYVNKSLHNSLLYSIDNYFDFYSHQAKITTDYEVSYKSSDEEIAKWDEDTKSIIGVSEGTAKITVKVKVIVTPDDPDTDDNEEKSYTMKRKFKLTVKTRDLDPAGYYDGDYVLTTSTSDLADGTRLLLVGTRVKDDTNTDYIMGENNSMMGGGKTGSKYEFKDQTKVKIPCEDVPKATLEVVLEQDGAFWNLRVGEDENGTPLYLYASVKAETEQSGSGSGGGFMEMFNPSSGMKVGTMAAATADSLKATISFAGNIATIKFPKVADDKNNTIMLSSAFDMESMMGSSTSTTTSTSTSSFDLFMASFNTKKPGDETAEAGKDPKCFLPRIYRFVPDASFGITIGNTGWKTIVTYKDVEVPENVEAYIVTKVQPEETQSVATLLSVEKIKGGVPYLLHVTSGSATDYTMTLTSDEVTAPTNNMLEVSDRTTTGSSTSSTVYVLANKSKGVGFYRWTGDELGAGRVYLPVGTAGAPEYCGFYISEATAIQSIDDTKTDVGPFYDLQGRRVEHPTNGIYIVNGKKVVVK